jgi:hypothetical protein
LRRISKAKSSLVTLFMDQGDLKREKAVCRFTPISGDEKPMCQER